MNQYEMNAPGDPLAGGTGREDKQVDTAILAALARDVAKVWLRVQAQCLLVGFKADIIDCDDGRPMLVVSRWALTRSFTDPGDVATWLARVAPAVTGEVAS